MPRTRTCPRNGAPATQTWTYVYNHNVDRKPRWSDTFEQPHLLPFSFFFSLFGWLLTQIPYDRKMAMPKVQLSADNPASPTARQCPTESQLDKIIRYGMILIHFASSSGDCTLACTQFHSDAVSSLTASLTRSMGRLCCQQQTEKRKKKERKKNKKRAIKGQGLCLALKELRVTVFALQFDKPQTCRMFEHTPTDKQDSRRRSARQCILINTKKQVRRQGVLFKGLFATQLKVDIGEG